MLVLLSAMALAKSPPVKDVEICMRDQAGRPLGGTRLAVKGDDVHNVNPISGCWANNAMYQVGGSTVSLQDGVVLELLIAAPGFAPEQFSWAVNTRRLDVTLEPALMVIDPTKYGITPEAALARAEGDSQRLAIEALQRLNNKDPVAALALADRSLATPMEGRALATAVRAVAATQLWAAEVERYSADPSPTKKRDDAGRARAVSAAKDWMVSDGPGRSAAYGLCVAATMDPAACAP